MILIFFLSTTEKSGAYHWNGWRGQLNTLLYIASQFQRAVKTSNTVRLKAGFSAEIMMINWRSLEFRTENDVRLTNFKSHVILIPFSRSLQSNWRLDWINLSLFFPGIKMCRKKNSPWIIERHYNCSYLFSHSHFVLLRFSFFISLFFVYTGRMWIVIYYRMNTISGSSLMLFLSILCLIRNFFLLPPAHSFLRPTKIFGSFSNQVCSKFGIDETSLAFCYKN